MADQQELIYYFKKNVPYTVGVRYHVRDTIGKALNGNDPYVAVKESALRDFKRANRRHLMDGLILQVAEPWDDEETPNALTDEQAAEIVKNVFMLKKTLKEVTSDVPLFKLLEEAKIQNRPKKTIDLIEARIQEVVGELPTEMQGEF